LPETHSSPWNCPLATLDWRGMWYCIPAIYWFLRTRARHQKYVVLTQHLPSFFLGGRNAP
jgi:hypothetical protein